MNCHSQHGGFRQILVGAAPEVDSTQVLCLSWLPLLAGSSKVPKLNSPFTFGRSGIWSARWQKLGENCVSQTTAEIPPKHVAIWFRKNHRYQIDVTKISSPWAVRPQTALRCACRVPSQPRREYATIRRACWIRRARVRDRSYDDNTIAFAGPNRLESCMRVDTKLPNHFSQRIL